MKLIPTTRPVGQEVKTGASHAPNVGSIPARVTIFCCLLRTNLFTNQLECAILLRQAEGRKESKDLCFVSFLLGSKLVSMTTRVHPFPFRTRKLSSSVAKILVWRRTGKIARCQHKDSSCETAAAVIFISVARQVFSDRFQSKRLLRLEKEEAVPQNQHETAVSCWRRETAK